MNRKRKTILLLSFLAIGLGAIFYKFVTRPLPIESYRAIENEITEEIDPLLDKYILKEDYYFFLYSKDYSKRHSFLRDPVIINPSSIVKGDLLYEESLIYHRENQCFIIDSKLIPKNTLLYDVFQTRAELYEKDWYASCPIFYRNDLIGYASVIKPIESIGVVEILNKVRLISSLLEKSIEKNL